MRDETPVLIGAGQFTFWGFPENSPSPLELLRIAAKCAVAGRRMQGAVLARFQAVAVVAFSGGGPGEVSRLSRGRASQRLASRFTWGIA